MKEQLSKHLKDIEDELWGMNKELYENPELGDQEFESMKLLTSFLKEHHFEIEIGTVNRPTAFKAVYKSNKPGPTIAFLAEYDALPGVGHGCGHNLIGTMGVGAGVTLSKMLAETGGSVVVLGTPAEETNGAKVPMAAEGIFNDVDVAMILHPSDQSYESGESLAMDAIQYAFTGKSAHAAASPEQGINALDSVIQLFNGINALRQHVTSDVRIHGVISDGGKAANVVPDYAVAQFYIRASSRNYLNEVVQKVKHIAEGAALMTGASLEVSNYELSYDDMITNQTLSEVFNQNLKETSKLPLHKEKSGTGSIDMGNVSQVVPAIHPYIGMNKPGLVHHTKEFADQTVTEDGFETLVSGALALAQTGYDILVNEDLLRKIKDEFNSKQ